MYTNTCKICGKEFQATMPHANVCTDCKNRPCEICGKSFKHEWPYDQRVCSPECRHKLRTDPKNVAAKEAKKRATVQEKYGVDNVAKIPEVRKKNVEHRQTAEFKQKVEHTSLTRYGVKDYRSAPEVKAKIKEGHMRKYGVDNVAKLDSVRKLISEKLKDPEVRAKYCETSMKHYGVPYPHMNPAVKAKTEQTMIDHYGVPYYVMLPEYRSSQATNQISLINQTVGNSIKEKCDLDVEYEFKIDTKFYDIHVKDTNILIEINPAYTHSNLPNHWGDGLSSDYHLVKSLVAQKADYKCIHIFDWDNIEKIIKMLNKSKSIYARQCKLERLDAKQVHDFININHLQGDARGAKFCYGLIYNGELVSAMTFGKPRYNNKFEWELLRLCTASGYNVIGGASRMFKHFIKDANPTSIISYCDRSKFTGSVYEKIGMTLSHTSPPAKVWSKEDQYITDNFLRQRGYDQIFGTNFGKGTSNEELMIKAGWRSVYDCGQLVYKWENGSKIQSTTEELVDIYEALPLNKLPQYQSRNCKKCGKSFKPTSGRNFYCHKDHEEVCKMCGKTYIIKYADLPYPRNVCYNPECAKRWRKHRKLILGK